MRAEITVSRLDGGTWEASGDLAPLADRIAFERMFGQSAAVLTRIAESFDSAGRLLPDADPSSIREEWVAFLAWRMVRRGPARDVEFASFLDELAEIEVRVLDREEDEAVPTGTAAPLPTS